MVKLNWAIWVINSVLQWILLTVVLREKRWRQVPAFAIYILFCSIKTSLLIGVTLLKWSWYFPINWGSRIIGAPLLIAVLIEIFAAVFRPYSTLPKGTLQFYRSALFFLVVLTTLAAFYFPGQINEGLKGVVFLLNRSASFVFCGAFTFTALLSSYFGIPWRTRIYGIGVGFLLFMTVDILVSSLGVVYGAGVDRALSAISMLGYTLALVTWIYYFLIPDKASPTPTLEQMRRLQKALDYSSRKVESFRGTR